MTVTIVIDTDNEAFQGAPERYANEVAYVFMQAREWVQQQPEPDSSYRLRDSNGNTVGEVRVTEDESEGNDRRLDDPQEQLRDAFIAKLAAAHKEMPGGGWMGLVADEWAEEAFNILNR